jgi:2-dehydropantoate 2-reductase
MKVCIVGAGAIGGWIGTRLAAGGECAVSAVARGDTLAALQAHGWRLWQDGTLLRAPVCAAADARDLGPQDVVVVAVKAPAMLSVLPAIGALVGPDTIVLPAMNGVPWWFAQRLPALGDAPLHSVDPDGAVSAAIGLQHVVGCVVHASAAGSEPGVVRHAMGRGLIVGEPAGGGSARVDALAAVLARAGFEVTASSDIRRDVWYKLWGNLTMNPVSVLTGATIDRVLDDPLTRAFCTATMREAADVGARIGCAITQTLEDRHAVTRRLGAFRTSMLLDAEAGRPIELDAIVGAVVEIARRLDMATPCIDALYGMTRLYGRVHGLYPAASAP